MRTDARRPAPAIFLFVLLLTLTGLARSTGPASAVHDTDLKSEPTPTGATITEIAKGTSLQVGQRKGGWFQVRLADQQEGWVRMLAVRYDTPAGSGSFTGTLAEASRSDTTVATGVRGLDKEMLAQSQPNHQRLQKLLGFDHSAADAQQFARQGGLTAREVAYQ